MCDNINTTQNAQFGSHDNSFVAQQINNYGVSVEQMPGIIIDATFRLFHQYFPQLQKESLEEVHRMLEEKLKKIPPEDIVPPAARIAIPTLQNASITEEHDIRELYATLLANSMNKAERNGIHPSFTNIIAQLTPDEAKFLSYMQDNTSIPTISLRAQDKEMSGITVVSNFTDLGEKIGCEMPSRADEYLDNLERLGLIKNMGDLGSLTDKSLYEALRNHPYIISQMQEIEKWPELNLPQISESYARLTNFGKAFCKACCEVNNNVTVILT